MNASELAYWLGLNNDADDTNEDEDELEEEVVFDGTLMMMTY